MRQIKKQSKGERHLFVSEQSTANQKVSPLIFNMLDAMAQPEGEKA